MVELSFNPIRIVTRILDMGKLGRILVILGVVIVVSCIYIGSVLRLNGLGYATVWVLPLGYMLFLGILAEQARIGVIFCYGVGRPARVEEGDHPLHDGGYMIGVVAVISNKGGRALSLEPHMALSDKKTKRLLSVVNLMPNAPLPEKLFSEKNQGYTNLYVGNDPYCPQVLKLVPGDTGTYRLYFFVDSTTVEKLGMDKIGNNLSVPIPVPKVSNTQNDLLFVDRALNIKFVCERQYTSNNYECKRLRLN